MKLRNLLTTLVFAVSPLAVVAQSSLPPTSGMPGTVLSGTTSASSAYTCDTSHIGIDYKQINASTGATVMWTCTASGGGSWVIEADAYGAASAVQTADQAAFTGDVTKAAGAFATTVTAINGGAVPKTAGVAALNASGQIINATAAQTTTTVNGQSCALGGTCTIPMTGQTTGENVVTSSATPTFNGNVGLNTITLSANVTSFTMAAPTNAGSQTCLVVVQGSSTAYTMAAPSNVIGFMTISTATGKRNAQCFSYSSSLSLWVATSAGVVGH